MKRAVFGLGIIISATICGCVEKGCTDPEALNYNSKAQRDDESCNYGDKYVSEKEEAILNHAAIAYALYSDAVTAAVVLDTTIQTFLDAPSSDAYSLCKLACQQAYYQYAQCAPLRFSGGPIDGETNHHQLIGAWPIDPSKIDYTPMGEGGLVADAEQAPTLNEKTLKTLNSASNIVSGFHVIEFLLWGLDVDDPEDITVGYRTFEDYDLQDSTNITKLRRREYLATLSAMIVNNLTIVRNEWDPEGISNYQSQFLKQEVNVSMKQILTGLATLSHSEMVERAIDDPRLGGIEEHEISAYSDNTTFDLIAMNSGIESVVLGSYTASNGEVTKGFSLIQLAALYDPELSIQLASQIETSKVALEDIPAPFDYQMSQEIAFGDGPIAEAAVQLEAFEDLCFELAREMDFGLNTDLPE